MIKYTGGIFMATQAKKQSEVTMATNKELEKQVKTLTERLSRVQASNSHLLDEVAILKNNYNKLVADLSERLEAVHKAFRGQGTV